MHGEEPGYEAMAQLLGTILGIPGYLLSQDPWDSMPGGTTWDYPGYPGIFRPGKLDLLFASATYSICNGARLLISRTDHRTRGSCVFTDIPRYPQYFGRKVYYAQL